MQKAQLQVQLFHKEILNGPTSPAPPQLRQPHLRARLILEEAIETAIALVGSKDAQNIVHEQLLKVLQETAKAGDGEPNLIEAIDGLTDLLYVVYGSFEDVGVDAEPFMDEVHRSNMAKAGGPIDAQGKQQKPPGWTPPDLEGVLKKMLEERAA